MRVSAFHLCSDLEADLLIIRPTCNSPNPVRDNFRVADDTPGIVLISRRSADGVQLLGPDAMRPKLQTRFTPIRHAAASFGTSDPIADYQIVDPLSGSSATYCAGRRHD